MSTAPGPRIAYVMSRFPKISETFVLYEMKALEELGADIEVFPLQREPPGRRHPDAEAFEARAHFLPHISARVVRANVRRFLRDPGGYLRTWGYLLKGTWGSAKFFFGALLFFPKCVAFAESMEAAGVDHVHAHFAHHPALAALAIHRLTGLPFSFTAHGSDLHVDRRMLPQKVSEAAFVVTVSGYNRRLIVEECGEAAEEKVVVIHCGVDPNVFIPRRDESAAEAPPASKEHAVRIACVASLEEVKGHRFLLEACKVLADRGIDVACELAGDGPLRHEIENLVLALGLKGRVILHGPLPTSEVHAMLLRSDVAVLASHPTKSGRREGIPVALMEAMMSGLPVVASGLSGIPELVDDGHTGYLVPPGDPWTLADRVQRLAVAPELRRRMGRAGREKVIEEFDLWTGARLLLEEVKCRARSSRYRDT